MARDMTAVVLHYGSVSFAYVNRLPVLGVWYVRSVEHLRSIEAVHGRLSVFGQQQLPATSLEPLGTCTGVAGQLLPKGLMTLLAARSQVPLLPPRPYFRLPIVWTEDTDRFTNTRFAIVAAYDRDRCYIAVVFTTSQLEDLARRFYPRHVAQIVSAIYLSAQLPSTSQYSMLLIEDRKLAADIIQGMVMSRELPLPSGV